MFSQDIGKDGLKGARQEGQAGVGNAADKATVSKGKMSTSCGRKRPRSWPSSRDAVKDSRNPFSGYKLLSTTPPRPGSPKARAHGKRGMAEMCGGVSHEGSGLCILESVGRDDDFAVAHKPRSARGNTDASPVGDGSVSSPVLLGLSSAEEEEDDALVDGAGGAGAGANETGVVEGAEPSASRVCGGELGGDGRGDVDSLSAPCAGEHVSSGSDALAEQEEEEAEVEEEVRNARRLLFLVSRNTGRVHVYEEHRQGAGDDTDAVDENVDDEDTRPRHCRLSLVYKCRLEYEHRGSGYAALP